MKGLVAIAASLLVLSACGRTDSTDTDQTTADRTASGSSALERIAGDKTEMAELMRLSHQKGTFDDALALTMRDSIIADAVFDAVIADDRFIAITTVGTPVSPSGTSPSSPTSPSSTPKKVAPKKLSAVPTTSRQRSSTTPARNGDVLDNAERTAQAANERLEQAERIKREAEEAKRRVEGILGR